MPARMLHNHVAVVAALEEQRRWWSKEFAIFNVLARVDDDVLVCSLRTTLGYWAELKMCHEQGCIANRAEGLVLGQYKHGLRRETRSSRRKEERRSQKTSMRGCLGNTREAWEMALVVEGFLRSSWFTSAISACFRDGFGTEDDWRWVVELPELSTGGFRRSQASHLVGTRMGRARSSASTSSIHSCRMLKHERSLRRAPPMPESIQLKNAWGWPKPTASLLRTDLVDAG